MESKAGSKRVGDVLSPKLLAIGAEESITEAARIMREDGVGSLLVRDQDKAVGILTDRDMVVRCLAPGRDPSSTRAQECMTHRVVTCEEDASLEEAAGIMLRENVRRLVICDENELPIGMLSIDDLAFHLGDDRLFHEAAKAVSHSGKAAA